LENLVDHSEDFRFDNIQRTERYFTATLFPAVLLHDDFRGLQAFLDRVQEKAPCPRAKSGSKVPTDQPIPRPGPANVELITEFHITRDLRAAGKYGDPDGRLQGNAEAGAPASPEAPVRLDVPDVVIVVGSELIVCEGKFFGSFSRTLLDIQLKSQHTGRTPAPSAYLPDDISACSYSAARVLGHQSRL
jgi:hypothetical protein